MRLVLGFVATNFLLFSVRRSYDEVLDLFFARGFCLGTLPSLLVHERRANVCKHFIAQARLLQLDVLCDLHVVFLSILYGHLVTIFGEVLAPAEVDDRLELERVVLVAAEREAIVTEQVCIGAATVAVENLIAGLKAMLVHGRQHKERLLVVDVVPGEVLLVVSIIDHALVELNVTLASPGSRNCGTDALGLGFQHGQIATCRLSDERLEVLVLIRITLIGVQLRD